MATLWQRVKGLFGVGGSSSVSAGGLLNGVLQNGAMVRRGSRELLTAYRTHPWLHAVVHRIASEVSAQHFLLFRSESTRRMDGKSAFVTQTKNSIAYAPRDAKEVADHPLLQLLENPNPFFTRAMLMHLVQAFLDVKGEVALVIERNGAGVPIELWPVPPTWILDIPHHNFPSYRFGYGAWQRTISEDDVIYLRHPDLEQPYMRGVGFGETLADEIDVDEYATAHLKTWFFNRAIPDVFLSVEGVSSEVEALRYEEKLRAKHGGKGKAFQVHVTNGKIDVKELGHTFREQMLPEIRTQSRDVALQVYGMPPEIMGIVENSNRATIDAATLIFTKFLITPRMSFLADALTHWARREYSDPALCLGFISPIPEDSSFALEVFKTQPTLFTKNEWRILAGRAPVEGWDEEYPDAPAVPAFGAPAGGEDPEEPEDVEATVEDQNEDATEPEDDAEDAGEERGFLRLVRSLGVRG